MVKRVLTYKREKDRVVIERNRNLLDSAGPDPEENCESGYNPEDNTNDDNSNASGIPVRWNERHLYARR